MVRANDVTVVADKDHDDPAIVDHLREQLPALASQGLRHLYLEQDPHEISVDTLAQAETTLGKLTAEAQRLGIEIHLFDDSSARRALDAQYPAAAAYVRENDRYMLDTEALVAGAPNAGDMRAYLAGREQTSGSQQRNASILTNIDHGLRGAPNEKAMVLIGAWHVEQRNDIDEALRERGHQVGVIEIKSDQSLVLGRGPDAPDFIARTETGETLTYKRSPGDSALQRATEGLVLPWRNTEAVMDMREGTTVHPSVAHGATRDKDGPAV